MAQEGQVETEAPRARSVQLGQTAWAWVGVSPFFLFALLFLILPTLYLVVGAFQDADGVFTLNNVARLFCPEPDRLFCTSSISSAYWISIKVSVASAVVGALLGFALAYAAVLGGLPQWLRPTSPRCLKIDTFRREPPAQAGRPRRS